MSSARFSPSLRLVFILLTVSFIEILILMKSSLSVLIFGDLVVVLYLESHHQTQGHLDFSPELSLGSCIVLWCSVFRSVIHFEFTFVKGVREVLIRNHHPNK